MLIFTFIIPWNPNQHFRLFSIYITTTQKRWHSLVHERKDENKLLKSQMGGVFIKWRHVRKKFFQDSKNSFSLKWMQELFIWQPPMTSFINIPKDEWKSSSENYFAFCFDNKNQQRKTDAIWQQFFIQSKFYFLSYSIHYFCLSSCFFFKFWYFSVPSQELFTFSFQFIFISFHVLLWLILEKKEKGKL